MALPDHPWATLEQITTLTGRAVTEQTRTLAVSAVELSTGLIEEVYRIDLTDRDRYWLRCAVAYQAAWLLTQSDYLERNAVASVSQDGQTATAGNADWLILSPLARKAIRKLSWRNPRVIEVGYDERIRRLNVLLEQNDDVLRWTPLGGA